MTQREKVRKLRQLRSKLNQSYLKIREIPADRITSLLQEANALGDIELIFFAEIQLVIMRYDIVSLDVTKEMENWVVRVEEYGFFKLSFLLRLRLANRVFVFNPASEYIQLAYILLKELSSLEFPKEFNLQCRTMLLINIGSKISFFLPSHHIMIQKKISRQNYRFNDEIYDLTRMKLAETYYRHAKYSKALDISLSIYFKNNRHLKSSYNLSFTISLLSSISIKNFDLSYQLVAQFYDQSESLTSYNLMAGVSYAVIKFYIETHQLDLARKLLGDYFQEIKKNQKFKTQHFLFSSLQSDLLAVDGNYKLALELHKREYYGMPHYLETDQMIRTSDLRSIVDLITEESLPDYYLRQSRRKRMAEIKSWLFLNQKLYHHFVLNGLNDLQSSVYLGSNEDQLALTAKFRVLVESMSLTSGKMWHSLQDEIKLLWMYRELMVCKYGFSPELQVDVPDDLLEVGCPYLLLQGVMENAFKHGYNSGQQRFVMQLRVRFSGNTLHITFTDNGEGNQQLSMIKPAMIGLSTNRQRMEMLSAWTGVPAGIDVIFASAGQTFGTSVLMQLPRLSTPCGVADYHLALCKKDQQKFSRSHAAVS